jgi:hypothetical protein
VSSSPTLSLNGQSPYIVQLEDVHKSFITLYGLLSMGIVGLMVNALM